MIKIRKIEFDDLDSLLELRNLELDRRYYQDSSEVSFSDHKKWVMSRTQSDELITLVAEFRNMVIGVCYLNQTSSIEAEVSIRIFPDWRGTECARLLFSSIAVDAQKQGIARLVAVVHLDNKRSIKFFTNLGFIELGLRNEIFQEFGLDLGDLS